MQGAKPGGSTCRLQVELEPQSDEKASGSLTASSELASDSEIQDKPDTAKTPRVSGDLTADPCQQRLELTQELKLQRRGEDPGLRLAKSTHRKLQDRSKRCIRKYLEVALERFLRWADDEGRELREEDAMDSALVGFLNHRQFLLGLQAWEGERLLAALLFFWLESGRCGGRRIPRAWRCVKGWRRVTPGKSCKPHSLMTWRSMAADWGVRAFPLMAIYLMISLSGYSRPSEGLPLTRINVLLPVAGVSEFWSLL